MMTYRMDIVTMYGTRLVSTFDHLDGAIACLRQQAQHESTVSARLVACEKQNGTLRLGEDDAGNPLGMRYEVASYTLNLTAPWIKQ